MMVEHPDVFSSLQHFDHIIKIVAWGGGVWKWLCKCTQQSALKALMFYFQLTCSQF